MVSGTKMQNVLSGIYSEPRTALFFIFIRKSSVMDCTIWFRQLWSADYAEILCYPASHMSFSTAAFIQSDEISAGIPLPAGRIRIAKPEICTKKQQLTWKNCRRCVQLRKCIFSLLNCSEIRCYSVLFAWQAGFRTASAPPQPCFYTFCIFQSNY